MHDADAVVSARVWSVLASVNKWYVIDAIITNAQVTVYDVMLCASEEFICILI
jgi:hypothetical protein